MGRPKGSLETNSLASRVLDILETDGGWLSMAAIVDLIDGKPDSIRRAVWRLHTRDKVELRRLDAYAYGGCCRWRYEWRAV